MSNFDSGAAGDEHWEERGELAWNEFDWERYLRGQAGAITRYLRLYDEAGERPDRIDHVAEQMDWGAADWTSEEGGETSEDATDVEDEVYTLHKNPIYIATRALYLSLTRSWKLWPPRNAKYRKRTRCDFWCTCTEARRRQWRRSTPSTLGISRWR